MQTPDPETALVLRAQCGDRAAFDELLRGVDKMLLRYITAIVGSGAAAEDILQEVLIKVVRKIVWLRDPELFRPWAFRIASREAFRSLRRELRSEPLSDSSAVEEETTVDPWLRERLAAAIPRLSEPTRAVIHLHYIEELALSDVAAVLEISPGTVKSRLSAALTKLRKELAWTAPQKR